MAETEELESSSAAKHKKVSCLISELRNLDEPLFCDAIIEILNIDHGTHRISFDGIQHQFVDSETLTFIQSSLLPAVDKGSTSEQYDLNDQVVHLLPLCKRLAIESHAAVTARMKKALPLEMTELPVSPWTSANLSLLCSQSDVERVFGVVSVTARLEWVISCLVDRRLQLKDNLQSEQLKHILGKDLVLVLQCVLGCVRGFNLKNLTWHGFTSPSNLPKQLCSLLYCSILTLISRMPKSSFKARTSAIISPLHNLPVTPEISLSTCQLILRNSALVHPDQLELWLTFVQLYCKNLWYTTSSACENVFMLVSINVVLLQHCLRRLWVVASGSDVTRCYAQNTEFYITLDEIFFPHVPSDIPRPGASYFTSIYSKHQSYPSSGNVLIPVLGSGPFYALLDLFVHGDGLRLRDKLSHCECDSVDVSISRHLFYLSLSILAQFCDAAAQKSSCDLVTYCDNYQHRFHPSCMMLEVVENIEITAQKLTDFVVEAVNFGIEEKKAGFVEDLFVLIKSLHKFSMTESPVSLFIGQAKAKYFSLILEILRNIDTFSTELFMITMSKFELFKDRKLRSRQRQNFSTLIGALPCFTQCIALSRTFMCFSTDHVEKLLNFDFEHNKGYVKFLKTSLKCFENLVAIVSQSKWVEIGCFLSNYLENWIDLIPKVC